MSSHLAVILSPSSGANNNEDLQNRLTESFSATRDSEVRILLAGNREEIVELAERAIAEGADPIVAGGGNGTLNAVASVLVGTERTLGALPLGTLNHFAKDSEYPTREGRAVIDVLVYLKLIGDLTENEGLRHDVVLGPDLRTDEERIFHPRAVLDAQAGADKRLPHGIVEVVAEENPRVAPLKFVVASVSAIFAVWRTPHSRFLVVNKPRLAVAPKVVVSKPLLLAPEPARVNSRSPASWARNCWRKNRP